MNDDKQSFVFTGGLLGFLIGVVLGFIFNVLNEQLSGLKIRRGIGADMRADAFNAIVGGVIGLVGGAVIGLIGAWTVGAFKGNKRSDWNSHIDDSDIRGN